MAFTIDEVVELISIFRECTRRRYDALCYWSPASRLIEHLHLAKKECVMEACSKWLRKYSKWKRVQVTACSKAFFEFLRHRNVQKLLESLNSMLGW